MKPSLIFMILRGEAPYPYPKGKERESINKAFDEFFKVFKTGNKFPEHQKPLVKSLMDQQKLLKAKRTRRKKRKNKR